MTDITNHFLHCFQNYFFQFSNFLPKVCFIIPSWFPQCCSLLGGGGLHKLPFFVTSYEPMVSFGEDTTWVAIIHEVSFLTKYLLNSHWSVVTEFLAFHPVFRKLFLVIIISDRKLFPWGTEFHQKLLYSSLQYQHCNLTWLENWEKYLSCSFLQYWICPMRWQSAEVEYFVKRKSE